jgi:hypothetical protein
MFYRLLGMAVWKIGVRYVRRYYGRQLRTAAVLAVITIAVAGYLAARSGE